MTEEQLTAEVMSDYESVVNFSNRKDNKFRRLVLKSSKFPVYAHSFYKSERRNNWIVFYEARTKKDVGDMCRLHCVVYYNSSHGYYAAMVTFTNRRIHLVIFAPHFFSRYAFRTGLSLNGIDLMVKYFRKNNSFVYELQNHKLDNTTYIQEISGTTSEGVALGLLTNKDNVLFKTFITYEMAKGEQIEKYFNNEKLRKEIHEND